MRWFLLICAVFSLSFLLAAEGDRVPLRESSGFLAPPLLYLHYPSPWNPGGISVGSLFLHGSDAVPGEEKDLGARVGGWKILGDWVLGGGAITLSPRLPWGIVFGGGYQLLGGNKEDSSVIMGAALMGGVYAGEEILASTLFIEASKEVGRIPTRSIPHLVYLGVHLDQGYGIGTPPRTLHTFLSALLRGYVRVVLARRWGIAYSLGTIGKGIYLHSLEVNYILRGYP